MWPFGGVRWLVPPAGGQPLSPGLPGGDAHCAFEAPLAGGPDSALWEPRGGGGEAGRGVLVWGWVGRSRFENWGAALATRLRIGLGARERAEEGVGDSVLLVWDGRRAGRG